MVFFRYQHLTRDFVDEKDYPPTQEYFLYSDDKVQYKERENHPTDNLCCFRMLIFLTAQTDSLISSS